MFFSGITSATLFPDEPLKGLTFSVSDDFNEFILLEGTHFHSRTGHEFGNPEGKAEVGYFGSVETVRGLTEFDLTNLTNLPSVCLTFHVFNNGGLFDSGDFTNDFPFDGIIDVFAYEGNNLEDIDDYQKPPIYADTVGGFSTAALIVGDILSVDVTEI